MKRNIFKRYKWSVGVLAAAFSLTFTSCSDFFNPDTDDQVSDKHYISENTEMYTGFVGLLTKMQAIGDKEEKSCSRILELSLLNRRRMQAPTCGRSISMQITYRVTNMPLLLPTMS